MHSKYKENYFYTMYLTHMSLILYGRSSFGFLHKILVQFIWERFATDSPPHSPSAVFRFSCFIRLLSLFRRWFLHSSQVRHPLISISKLIPAPDTSDTTPHSSATVIWSRIISKSNHHIRWWICAMFWFLFWPSTARRPPAGQPLADNLSVCVCVWNEITVKGKPAAGQKTFHFFFDSSF